MMQIYLFPFPGVSLVGTVLMFPVMPCGPGHEMHLFPIGYFISAPEILPLHPQHSQQAQTVHPIVMFSISVLSFNCPESEHAETQGTAGCHTLPACPSLAGADMAQGKSRTKANKLCSCPEGMCG